MSSVVNSGQAVVKDPDAERVYVWDWDADLPADAEIVGSDWSIDPSGTLTIDTPSILASKRQTQVRIKAGTLGANYRVTNRITTNTSPSETEDASIVVQVRQQ